MKRLYKGLIFLFFLICLCLSLLGKPDFTVQAGNTCTWNGGTDINWFLNFNWSNCDNVVPTAADDVVIPAGVTRFPTINWRWDPQESSAWANVITIESDAQLTIMDGSNLDAFILVNNGTFNAEPDSGPVSFGALVVGGSLTNNGTLNVNGTSNGSYFNIYSSFTNTGTVNLAVGSLGLLRGGIHSGDFFGETDTTLYIGGYVLNQTFTFNAESDIRVPHVFVREGITNIAGRYWPPAVGSRLTVNTSDQSAVIKFNSTANVVTMAANVDVSNRSKIYFESPVKHYTLTNVYLDHGGEINNAGSLSISNQFLWYGGKLSGSGSTEILNGAIATIRNSAYSPNIHELDAQHFLNSGTVNWTGVDITLLNNAVFQNDGIFNANATTTMSTGDSGSFENNGSFYKNTAGTTTTMNVEFINSGTVEVIAGTLNFPLGMTSSSGTTVDLGGGSLTSGGEGVILSAGASLVGSGEVYGDLENNGEVSPGSSPGLITLFGNYTQSMDGVLKIELGGLTAGTQFDQLVINGSVNLAGDLLVTLIDPFSPQAGDQFAVLTYTARINQFNAITLPALAGGLEWETEYSDTGLSVKVKGPEQVYVFLPLLMR